MRFHQLPVGEHFTYQGKRYIKSNQLIAVRQDSGAQQFLPRSAAIEPLATMPETEPAAAVSGSLPARLALEAHHDFYRACLAAITSCGLDDATRTALENRINAAHQHYLNSLKSNL